MDHLDETFANGSRAHFADALVRTIERTLNKLAKKKPAKKQRAET